MLEEIIALRDSLPEFGKAQLRIARLEKTRDFIKDVELNPGNWANQELWEAP